MSEGRKVQLLCRFTNIDEYLDAVEEVKNDYTILYDKIYILQDVENVNNLFCTFNIEPSNTDGGNIIQNSSNTISVHRKKFTNTIYTINALNMLIKQLNNNVLDKQFAIPWENYRNSVMLIQRGTLIKISVNIFRKFYVNE